MPRPRWLSLWLPVLAWAAVIFTLSSIPHLSTDLGTWDLVLRKGAHVAEYAVLGGLLLRAVGSPGGAMALGVLYAVSDEVHQHFVAGRVGHAPDILFDAAGLLAGIVLVEWARERVRLAP
jgi:VanZ family protein